jgi:hypothetical protein
MTCQDVSFARARCRIEIESRSEIGLPMFVAHILIVEDDGKLLRELTFGDGRRVEIHANDETLALNSAVTYLEGRFGGRAEPEFDCDPTATPTRYGPPVVVDEYQPAP